MSLDLHLETDVCPRCGNGHEVFWRNMTHNVIPMWKKAGVYDALYMSEGKKAKEFVAVLQAGVADFKSNFSEYEKLNSPNGWGLAKHALPFLESVLDACITHPEATIRVSA